jgi:hypothetical protein
MVRLWPAWPFFRRILIGNGTERGWTVRDWVAVFGSYNFGITPGAPRTIALMGFALAF